MTVKTFITGIELRTGQKTRLLRGRRYYIKFSSGTVSRATKKTNLQHGKDSISWDEKLFLDVDAKDEFHVAVYQRHRFPRKRNELVGTLGSTLRDVMTKMENNVFEQPLRVDSSMITSSSEASFTLKFILIATPLDEDGTQATDVMLPVPAAVHAVDAQFVNIVKMFNATWGVLIKRIALFDKIVTGIAEIHPYASLTWSVLSSVNLVLVNHKYRDDQVIRLAHTMCDVFAFVHSTDPLNAIQSYVEPLKLLIQQVMECASFMCGYVEHKSSPTQMVEHTFSDIDARITNYQIKLLELRDVFLLGATLRDGAIISHLQDLVEDTAEKSFLKDLPFADGARHDDTKGCLPGTRESILCEIHTILNSPAENAPRVCLLTGVAGSGKSAVAHSIAQWYDCRKKLGSSYCFSRADAASRNPTNLFSTIARDLANHNRQYRFALRKVVETNRLLCTSRVPMEQLERLIIEPSEDIHPVGPLVIVIDALDECGDRASRQNLLLALSRLSMETSLPTNFRFLITTRPEDDILDELLSCPHLVRKEMGDISEESVDEDIERFIRHSIDQHSSELRSVDQDWCQVLVNRSQHLFQWTATACNFIGEIGHGLTGLELTRRARLLLETEKTESGYPLDELYHTVLLELFTSEPQRVRFREVMTAVLALKKPLPIPSLSALFDGHLKVPVDVRAIVSALASLLDGASNEQKPVRPLHASFYDFLCDIKRSSPAFYIPILPQHSHTLGQASLACMLSMLKFNICDLVDSRILNAAIPDLSVRVNRAIPPHLSYSCLYWMDHLQEVQCTAGLLAKVTLFFKTFFPYWIEVISLLSFSSPSPIFSALDTCTILQHWTHSEDQDISTLALEASQFIQVFSPLLRRSTPHLYLSAMPQTPINSPLCQLWANHLIQHASTITGHLSNWPVDIHIHALQGHEGFVTSVACSPDGMSIASGSYDKTVRVWHAATGQLVAGPFKGHEDRVTCVAYSPDGKRIVSGSYDRTIRVWDIMTGQSIVGPFQGHGHSVTSVSYSPNGENIASSSYDKTIRIWDAVTGQLMAGPFQGHEKLIMSATYSPDGKTIVSGSDDRTIRMWDVATGQSIADPCQGHEGSINSVAYSPDGKKIASGSNDNTIRIWDSTTSQLVVSPLQGHTASITSIAYSPDGMRIVSGSEDNTVRIWDTATGQLLAGPFQGHKGCVLSVAYLSDGNKIVSGSNDNTLRIWDATIGQSSADPSQWQGHDNWIMSIAYSPDGRNIVSGSYDKTIRIWDAITGQLSAGPFQGHGYSVTSVAYSPDGKKIAAGSFDSTISIWDSVTSQCIAGPLQGHENWVTSVAYSPDSKKIVSSSDDCTIRIWDATTGQHIAGPFQVHEECVTSVAYSPDGDKIASASDDSTIKIWDADSGQLIAGPFQGHESYVTSIAYSPDGKKIVSGSHDRTLRIWDTYTGQLVVGPLQGHDNWVRSVAYSPNGNMIVSGSDDKSIRIWDAVTGQPIAGPFQGHDSSVFSVSFSPDNNYIASASTDKCIKVWRVQDLTFFHNLHEDNGFIFSNSDLCYGWIAPWLRPAFYLPVLSLIISHHRTYQVQVNSTLPGESWVTCWKSS